jgi:hypothetical protein
MMSAANKEEKEEGEEEGRRKLAYGGDGDHGDGVGVEGGVPVGGAAEHDGLELGELYCGRRSKGTRLVWPTHASVVH